MQADRTSIDALLSQVDAAAQLEQQHTRPVKEATVNAHREQSYWMAVLAHNLLLYILVFGVIMVVSLPWMQDMVLCWIPRAVTPSGVLSTTGAFFKALLGTGAFILLQNVLFSGSV